jgi:hypothetical protein
MVQPIDYTVPMQSPLAAFEQAANMGMGIRQNQQTLEANRLKLEAEKTAQARQAEIQAAIGKLSSPDATADDYANVSLLLPKDQADSVRSAYAMKDKASTESALRDSSRVFTAFNAGKPEIAIKLMSDKISALRNSGKEQEAVYLENWLEVAKDDPDATKNFFGYSISQMPGGKDLLQSAIDFSKAPAEIAKGKSEATIKGVEAQYAPAKAIADLAQSDANIKNLQDQIRDRSRRFGLDSQRLANETADRTRTYNLNYAKTFGDLEKLPEATQKLVNDRTISAVTKEQLGQTYLDLAVRVGKSNLQGGIFSSATQAIMGLGGRPDQLRLEFARIKNAGVLASLPPGVATDKDVQLASKGFPKDNADKATIASFLRGMAILQMVQAAGDTAQAEWISSNGSLGKARGNMNVGGQAVQLGASFVDFNKKFVADAARKATAATAAPPAKTKAAPVAAGDAALLAKYGVK